MEEKRRSCIRWIKEHCEELIIAGLSVGAIMVMFLSLKNCAMMEEKLKDLRALVKRNTEELPQAPVENIVDSLDKLSTTHAPHLVRMHVRNLPEGKKPTPEKVAWAAELGYELLPNQTLVDSYNTGGFVA